MMKNYNIKILFGSNVREFRHNKGISQEKLAELSGLHRTYISDVERGSRSISLDNIKKIANALEIEVFKLFIFNEEDHYD
ncbi:helix-turn-helix domain-containing protein [Natronincola ferrireducens]|uniref:Helix-turn-helix n=1 Tax=Natronincola ferrireducens TaxID=393762 RepID=A0A1G9IES9_9FIRM|nr:helix-turn-helix transcriptional regulator [Natronincola ferrireducens]SDL23719.1 Helix-turn-helix [Natronincola ferrireducens]